WTGAALVTAQLLVTMAAFTGVLASLIFTIRPGMRKYKKIDLRIFDLVKTHINERNNQAMLRITFLGTHKFLIPANLSLIFYFLFIRKRTWLSIRVASISLSSLILMSVLKHLFHRKRPALPLL